MASKDVQFQSNTKKDLKSSLVKGSNEIHYLQFATGANRDFRKEYLDYCTYKLTGVQTNTPKPSTIGECVWGLYKRGVNPITKEPRTDEEFLKAIENQEIGPLGDTYIIPTGRDYTQVDQNGNILIASITSHLENYTDCGNILIDGQTGKTIRKSKPNVIINTCQKTNGFYPIEFYTTTTDKKTGEKKVTGLKYNFLSPDGKCVSPDFGFTKVPHEEKRIFSFNRNFYSRHDGTFLSDWDLYPKAYVYCYEKTPYFFNGEWELLQENKRRVENGLEPIVDDEKPFIVAMFARQNFLDEKTEELGKAFDDGAFSQEVYNDAMKVLNEEYNQLEKFIKNNETFLYIQIRENLELYKKSYPTTPTLSLPTKDTLNSSNPSDYTSDKELDR